MWNGRAARRLGRRRPRAVQEIEDADLARKMRAKVARLEEALGSRSPEAAALWFFVRAPAAFDERARERDERTVGMRRSPLARDEVACRGGALHPSRFQVAKSCDTALSRAGLIEREPAASQSLVAAQLVERSAP